MAVNRPMPIRGRTFQLAKVFGIRIGVSASWFLFLLLLILFLSEFFNDAISGSSGARYAIAVGGAAAYFGSLVLHELGHALVARRLGIPIAGIDLWFFGGLAHTRREPNSAGEEFKVAVAGPAVTLTLLVVASVAIQLLPGGGHVAEALFLKEGVQTTPLLALLGWVAIVNSFLLFFNIIPAFPLDGGRIARAAIWWRTGDRHRGTRITGRVGQGLALLLGLSGLLTLLQGEGLGAFTLFLALILYQAAGGAVVQGALGQRIKDVTVGDIMDREPVAIPAEERLLDAHEQFFLRYRWPWFAVVDQARHFLGVVRSERVDAEIAAGRPALAIGDVLEADLPIQIGESEPLESLLRSEGLGRLGGMVAVDGDGILRGVVTIAQIRQALQPTAGAS